MKQNNHLQNYMSSTMKEDRLNGLGLMMVHCTNSREHHRQMCGKASSKNAIGTYIRRQIALYPFCFHYHVYTSKHVHFIIIKQRKTKQVKTAFSNTFHDWNIIKLQSFWSSAPARSVSPPPLPKPGSAAATSINLNCLRRQIILY